MILCKVLKHVFVADWKRWVLSLIIFYLIS